MIEVQNITKKYGNTVVLDNLSFHVPKGQILGFLGPNGAGKTTTMRILTGYMAPSSGSVKIGDCDMLEQSLAARKKIGYLPETPPLYNELSVASYLDIVARLKGLKPSALRKERIEYVLKACWLEDVRHKLCSKLSKGYRQRVGIAQALIHDPEVIVLDEPTSGLDPKQIHETRELIKSLKQKHTVILSTHILPEVQMVCERVVIINKGKIIAEDTPEGLSARSQSSQRIRVKIRGEHERVENALKTLDYITYLQMQSQQDDSVSFIVDSNQEYLAEKLARYVVEQNWGLQELQIVSANLEDTFIQLITDEKQPEVAKENEDV